MRLPRVRIKVRGMILLVAAVALGLAIFEEFRDGLPPRFIHRAMPSRIGRLRPGMTRAQTREILGLDKSWWRGGVKVHFWMAHGNGHRSGESYFLRPFGAVPSTARVGDAIPISAGIHLRFTQDDWPARRVGGNDDDRLIYASFFDSRTHAEMPASPQTSP